MQQKILILYTSVGLGHKSIAENIGSVLEGGGFEVRLADILQVQEGWLTHAGIAAHHFINKYFPFLWSWLYQSVWFTNISLPYRIKVAGRNHLKTLELIQEYQPDIIITTQTSASSVVAFLKQQGLFNRKFGIAFSDYHLHRYWLYWQADFYLVNTNEQKQEMINLGIPAKIIFVCGITLKPKLEIDSISVRNNLGIGENDRVVLVSSGSLGTSIGSETISNLATIPQAKIFVICGKNRLRQKQLTKKFSPFINIKIFGYYHPMDELYAIADVYLTKPGGLSVAESLQWRLPILVSHYLPGQEELNYEYLVEKGLVMPEPVNVVGEVTEELLTHNFRQELEKNNTIAELLLPSSVLVGALQSVVQNVDVAQSEEAVAHV